MQRLVDIREIHRGFLRGKEMLIALAAYEYGR